MRLGFLLCRGLLKRCPGRALLIGLCAMVYLCGQMGLNWAGAAIGDAQETFAVGYGDIVVYADHMMPGTLETQLRRLPGVAAVTEATVTSPIRCVCTDGEVRSARFYAFSAARGTALRLAGTGMYALSYAYAAEFSAAAVSTLTLSDGQVLPVSGAAFMPWFTGVYVDSWFPSTEGDLVDVYTSPERLVEITGDHFVNRAIVSLHEGCSPAEVLEAIGHCEGVSYALPAEEEPAYHASQALGDVICRACRWFPWILVAIGLLFVCVFLVSAARSSCRSIWLLRADGGSRGTVFLGLFLYGFIAVSAGIVCAIPMAAQLAATICRVSLRNMGLPWDGLPLFPGILALGLGANFALVMIAAGIGALLPYRLPRRVRLAAVVLVPALSTAAVMFVATLSLLFMDSLETVRDEQFRDRYRFDLQLVYDDYVSTDRLDELQQTGFVERCAPMLLGKIELRAGDRRCETTCVGLPEGAPLTLRDADGAVVSPVENAILLSRRTAKILDVQPGEVVQLHIPYRGGSVDAICSVAGITQQSTAFLEAVALQTVEEYLDTRGVMNSATITLKPDCREAFLAYARTLPEVVAVQTGEGGQLRFDQRYAGTRMVVTAIVIISAMLGLMISLLMCDMQWRQNRRKNTILILLGESPLRLALRNGVLRQCGGLPGAAIGYIAGVCTAPRVLQFLSTDTLHYPFVQRWTTILLCCAIGAGCLLCGEVLYFAATVKKCTLTDNLL